MEDARIEECCRCCSSSRGRISDFVQNLVKANLELIATISEFSHILHLRTAAARSVRNCWPKLKTGSKHCVGIRDRGRGS